MLYCNNVWTEVRAINMNLTFRLRFNVSQLYLLHGGVASRYLASGSRNPPQCAVTEVRVHSYNADR